MKAVALCAVYMLKNGTSRQKLAANTPAIDLVQQISSQGSIYFPGPNCVQFIQVFFERAFGFMTSFH
jgi:hypothetical protein